MDAEGFFGFVGGISILVGIFALIFRKSIGVAQGNFIARLLGGGREPASTEAVVVLVGIMAILIGSVFVIGVNLYNVY